jgi:molecular chaperone DnaJ
MAEDYYRILGVDRDADLGKIKQAYRREAMKSHPDASGGQGSALRFRDVEEAYETLRDKDRREAYDRKLALGESAARRRGPRPGWGSPSALRPRSTAPFGPGPLGADPWSRELPGLETLFHVLGGLPFPRTSAWGSGAPLLEVLLSPEEALSGVEIPVELPSLLGCPACADAGPWGRLFCPECGGSGRLEGKSRITVELPAGVPDGAEFVCRVAGPAGGELGFRVRVLVGPR